MKARSSNSRTGIVSRGVLGLVYLAVASLLLGWIGRIGVAREWFVTVDGLAGASRVSQEATDFFDLLAEAGSTRGVVVLALVMVLILALRRRFAKSLILFGAASSAAVAQSLLKEWVGRARPGDLLMMETGSFPSGQAFVAVAVYGLFALFLGQTLRSGQARGVVYVVTLLFLGLLSYGRIVLEAHYVSDVIAGNLLGLVWLAVGAWVGSGRDRGMRSHSGLTFGGR